jgi:hypothetical protein
MNNNNNTIMAATATTIADETTTTGNNNNNNCHSTHATTAQVTFRVKCDTTTIGHGEDVYLVDSEGSKVREQQ